MTPPSFGPRVRRFGDNSTTGCGQFGGNETGCEAAWQLTDQGVPVTCFYLTGTCHACIGDNQLNALCTNTCLPCGDAARTTFAGGSFPDSCRAYDGNQSACEAAHQLSFTRKLKLTIFRLLADAVGA